MKQLLFWIRDHKLSTAGLVLVILGCVALVNLSRRVHHLKLRPAAASAGPRLTPAAHAMPEPLAAPARMRGDFEAAEDYLAFIRQALTRPQEGGSFYALLAWKRCNDVDQHRGAAAGHGANDAWHDAAVARVEDLQKRCAGVLATYADAPALYRVALEQGAGRDWLLPAGGRGIVSPATRETADADLDAALKTGDRWAAAQALRSNAGLLDVGNSTGDEDVDRQLRERAGRIVACELAGGCRRDIEASLHCVDTGDCAHEDDRDIVLAEVPDMQRIIFDTMLRALRERTGPRRSEAEDQP